MIRMILEALGRVFEDDGNHVVHQRIANALTPVVPRVMSRLFNHRNRLCPEEVIRTRRKLPAHDLLGFRFRQWQGSLAEHVAPACWSANISIAKPQLVVGWFISLHQLDP